MNEIWKKVTPIPPEINEGYLFKCRKCGQVLSYGGGKKNIRLYNVQIA